MAEGSAFAVIIKMVTSLIGDTIGMLKTQTGFFRELLSAMGGVFGAGGLSPYIGAAIVFIVAVLLIKFFLTSSKLILTLVGIGIFLLLLFVVF